MRCIGSFLVLAVVVDGTAPATDGLQGPSVADLKRAVTRVPRPSYKGNDFGKMSEVLNGHLHRKTKLSTAPCSDFTVELLQRDVLARIWELADPSLVDIYTIHGDRRQRVHATLQAAREAWDQMNAVTARLPELREVQRDGLCHEAVMWFVHHLTEGRQKELEGGKLTLPLLPEHRHELPTSRMGGLIEDSIHTAVHREYETRVSCQQCHSGPIAMFDPNATLMPPYPSDPKQPGLERKRECSYLYDPPCHPCEGLGGPRTGDGVHDFVPLNCSVVAEAKDVPESERPKPAFPAMGTSRMHGDARQPVTVRFDPTKPGKYPETAATISLAWDDTMYRHRYDFDHLLLNQPAAQIYLQTPQQAKDRNDTGAMVTILGREGHFPNICICMSGIAGIMQINAFVPHETMDPLDLPPDQGGSTYLGRIKLDTIDDGFGNRTVIADHWMKWAFHFLVDADPKSSSYGQPVRLYGSSGVRFVYSEWTLGDPRGQNPELFKVPKHCLSLSSFCRQQQQQDNLEESSIEIV